MTDEKPDYRKIIHSITKREDGRKAKLLQISSQLTDALNITSEEISLLRGDFIGIVFLKLNLSISAEPLPWSDWRNLLTIRPVDGEHGHTLRWKHVADDEELEELVKRLYKEIE